jgi:hypothetical protein
VNNGQIAGEQAPAIQEGGGSHPSWCAKAATAGAHAPKPCSINPKLKYIFSLDVYNLGFVPIYRYFLVAYSLQVEKYFHF